MVDVAIVGAGPGGAAAAVALGQLGITDVVLCDREGFPRPKTCGSGLSPNALKMTERLGLLPEVKAAGYAINAMRVVTPGGREMVLSSNAAAVVCLREVFDHLLVKRAQSLGVTLKAPFRVDALLREGGRVVGVRGADGEEVRARLVLCADGASAFFSNDPRPKRSLSTLMGWWDDFPVAPNQLDMIFDPEVAPLYGWMFPEGNGRVNIGICIDAQDASGQKTTKNLKATFQAFLDKHYAEPLKQAKQVGRLKGHPIVYTTWPSHLTQPGALALGEAGRMTHNATGEGISYAMESGMMAAEACHRVLREGASEEKVWRQYLFRHRRRFTGAFVTGHALRKAIDSSLLDRLADAFNNPTVRRAVTRLLGSALAGSAVDVADAVADAQHAAGRHKAA